MSIRVFLETVLGSFPGLFEADGQRLSVFGLASALVGSLVVIGLALNWLVGILQAVGSRVRTKALQEYGGSWAVVTGATSGIGEAIARALAQRGLNVCLVSRTQSSLERVSGEIESEFGVETSVVAIDLGDAGGKGWDELEAEMERLEGNGGVGILVNNAGLSYETATRFDHVDEALVEKLVMVNVMAVSKLTRIVLPYMTERGSGAIVNISSGHGRLPSCPLYALYAGTKAFVEKFSQSLATEVGPLGVVVQSQAPYMVISKVSKFKKKHESITIISPETYANSFLAALSTAAPLSVPHWSHAIQDALILSLPHFISIPLITSMHENVRKAAQRRAKKALEKQQTDTPSSSSSSSTPSSSSSSGSKRSLRRRGSLSK